MDIKEALGRISVDYVDVPVAEKNAEDGTLELEFNNDAHQGLVFEVDSTASPATELTNEPEPLEEEIAPMPEEPAASTTEEFEIPDSREVSASFDRLSREAEQTKIYTTYIPRFTEASENYRMAGERPREEAVAEAPVRKAVDEPKDTIDPTAELPEEAEVEAVIVTAERGVKLEEYAESISIFKFSGEDSALYEQTVEDNASDNEAAAGADAAAADTEESKAPVGLNDFSDYRFDEKKNEEKDTHAPVEEAPKAEDAKLAAYNPDGAKEKGKKRRFSEYTALYQRDSFKDRFLDSILSVRIRLASVILLSLAVLVFENIGYLGVDLAVALGLSRVPYAIYVIDLQFSVCLFLLALPEVTLAIAQLRKRIVAPELSLILSIALVCASSVANIILLPEKPLYVGFIFAVHVLVTVIGSCLRYLADFSAFKSTSKNTEKHVVDISMTSSLPKENIALDGAVDSYKSRSVRLFRASFITDFFKRTGSRTESSGANLTVMAISLGISLVSGAVAFFLLDGWISAAYALALTYLVGAPIVSLASHKMPYHRAQRLAAEEKTVIIGESSLYEYKDADVITFEDTEIFGADDVVLKRFMLYGDRENVARAMKLMSALFSAVGGPLDNIFASTLDKRVLPATSVTVEDDGVCGTVDGRTVRAGGYEYMIRHGIITAKDEGLADNGADTTKVMYAADGKTLIAKFYIRYSFSEEFSSLFTELRKNGIVPLVYTRDPNVNNELLKALTVGQGAMRVLKQRDVPLATEESVLKGSAGIVTLGDKINAIKTVLLAKRYSSLQGAISILAYILMGVGLGAAVVLTYLPVGVPSALLAIWHLVGCSALAIIGKHILAGPKK